MSPTFMNGGKRERRYSENREVGRSVGKGEREGETAKHMFLVIVL